MNKFIMDVEIVEQFATVLTLFRCFFLNAHCWHGSSLQYWLCIYRHLTNKETLPWPALREQMLDAIDNFVTSSHILCNLRGGGGGRGPNRSKIRWHNFWTAPYFNHLHSIILRICSLFAATSKQNHGPKNKQIILTTEGFAVKNKFDS